MHVHIQVCGIVFLLCSIECIEHNTCFDLSIFFLIGEHQMELLDFVAAKFHEEGGVFKLLVSQRVKACQSLTYSQ